MNCCRDCTMHRRSATPSRKSGASSEMGSTNELNRSFSDLSTTGSSLNPPPNNPMYKTRLCDNWKISGSCRFEDRCNFAHGNHELRSLPRYSTARGPDPSSAANRTEPEEVKLGRSLDQADLNGNETVPEWSEVGDMQYCATDVLGNGSVAIVFKGKYEGRQVAVKQVRRQHFQLVEREVKMLLESDSGDHVVRYFCTKADIHFHYLVLELCKASLKDHVENKMPISLSSEEILRQATKGLAHLHSINIVHRDLKPQNVLFANRDGSVRTVLADFGLCKMVRSDMSHLSIGSGVVGTDGWIAPEALKGQKTSFPMDVFSLGCVFYYVLSEGKHPFGEPDFRNMNIRQGHHSLAGLNAESHQLISRTLSADPDNRPLAKIVLEHLFFWEAGKQISFFCDLLLEMFHCVVSAPDYETKLEGINLLKHLSIMQFECAPFPKVSELLKSNSQSPLTSIIEENADAVIRIDWRNHLCDVVKRHKDEVLDKKCVQHKTNSVKDLLRFIRNLDSHYRGIPPHVRSAMGDYPNGFINYFTKRFPELLLHVHKVMECYSDDPGFKSYYSDEVRIRIKAEKEKEDELAHPSKWEAAKQLNFFCAVSERLYVGNNTTELSRRLQQNAKHVVKEDWIDQICAPLREHLTSLRYYKGWSVRDLVRAIRNMQMHYSTDVPHDVRVSMGEPPKAFMEYFTQRFPKLLLHVHEAMESCSIETKFLQYYSDDVRMRVQEARARAARE